MTSLSNTQRALERFRDARSSIRLVARMIERADDPGRFTVKASAQGHFASDSTYNQTHSDLIDKMLSSVVKANLQANLREVQELLRHELDEARNEVMTSVAGFLRSDVEH